MLAGTVGLVPQNHPVYTFLSKQMLPVCLVLLLIGTDLKALAGMGKKAFLVMLAGSAGTVLGGLIAYRLYRSWLPPEAWGGVGALAGSWTGGSANMIAVKEALAVPDGIIGPLIIIDAAIAYTWMALLIWSASFQQRWDNWIAPSNRAATTPGRPAAHRSQFPSKESLARPSDVRCRPLRRVAWRGLLLAIPLSIVLSLVAQQLAARLPASAAINASTWTVVLVTAAALLLSLTPLQRLEQAGVSRAGIWALYLLLASIGARADFRSILQTPAFLALGATWILIHGAVLVLAGRLLQAPLGLLAAASQANIGGTVSAPVVGATFSPQLAGLALLMAVLGNVTGTYIGLATAAAARLL